MGTTRSLALVVIVLLSAGLAGAQTDAPKLVPGQWLADHLQDPTLRIVDCREDIRDYWRGHIPGAVWLSPEALRWPESGVPGRFMGRDAFRLVLSALGVRATSTVIVYADIADYRPAYLLWALDYVQHPRFALLDGGYKAWQAGQRPTSQDYPAITAAPCDWLPAAPADASRIMLSQVPAALEDPNTVVLDVRPKDAYTGEKGFWKRNGHLPGAVWHFWQNDMNADGTLKSVEELKAAYAAIGVTPDKRIITSCGQGQMSAHTYFVLKHVLGFPRVANFDGGFNEWVSHDDLPVATGDQPG